MAPRGFYLRRGFTDTGRVMWGENVALVMALPEIPEPVSRRYCVTGMLLATEDLVDVALSEALAPVLCDLGNSGSLVPDVRDNQWSDFPGQVTAMLHSPDGTAQGVSAMAGEPLPQRIASVADQVQEWAVEALWRARPARDLA